MVDSFNSFNKLPIENAIYINELRNSKTAISELKVNIVHNPDKEKVEEFKQSFVFNPEASEMKTIDPLDDKIFYSPPIFKLSDIAKKYDVTNITLSKSADMAADLYNSGLISEQECKIIRAPFFNMCHQITINYQMSKNGNCDHELPYETIPSFSDYKLPEVLKNKINNKAFNLKEYFEAEYDALKRKKDQPDQSVIKTYSDINELMDKLKCLR